MSNTSRLAIISRHVVLLSARVPVYAVVLVEGERVVDVVEVSADTQVASLMIQYRAWNPHNFEDLYVSPGLIDLNVSGGGDWEGFAHLTYAAVSGGVTFCLATANLYGQADSVSSVLYCDVGQAYLVTSLGSLSLSKIQPCYALKAYMYPPSAYVEGMDKHLQELLQLAESANLPLFIDSSKPDSRLLYSASPCRHMPLEERCNITSWPEAGSFASAFADEIDPASLSDSGSECSPQRIKSANSPAFQALSTPVHFPYDSPFLLTPQVAFQRNEINEFPYIAEENYRSFHRSKSSFRQKTLVEDLHARIQKHMDSIQELSRMELLAYNKAGSTTFVASQRRSSLPGDIQLGIRQRPMLRLSMVKAGDTSLRESNYAFYLANHPDHWESNGVELVLRTLPPGSTCKVHFCNVSSAHSIAKIMTCRPVVTCETCPHYLYFSAENIRQGDTRMKTLPPIRGQGNQELLWDLLKTEQIDAICSHHQPVLPRYKLSGSWKQAANGLASLGFTLQSVWTKLRNDVEFRNHYIVRIAKWCAAGPARILGIHEDRGSIAKGKYADMVIWNPDEKLPAASRSKFPTCCPFQGEELYGSVVCTIVRGRWAYEKGVVRAVGRMEIQ